MMNMNIDYNSFKCEPLASLAYAYEENNPVNNALVDNVIGTLTGKKMMKAPKISIWCEVCSIEFNSQVTYDTHINGAKHAKKIKAKEILKSLQEEGQLNSDGDLSTLKCNVCNIVVNSSQQLQMHLSGSKHKAKCRKSEVVELTANTAEDGVQPGPAKQAKLFCEICSLTLNSDQQYQQHIASKKHKDKMEGKSPAKKKKKKKAGSGGNPNNSGFAIPPLNQSFMHTTTMA